MDWVNVNSKLPEPGKEVLVAVAGIGDYYPIYDIGYREPGGDHEWMLYGGTVSEITHWMPLPEAPPLPWSLIDFPEEKTKRENYITYAVRRGNEEIPAGYQKMKEQCNGRKRNC